MNQNNYRIKDRNMDNDYLQIKCRGMTYKNSNRKFQDLRSENCLKNNYLYRKSFHKEDRNLRHYKLYRNINHQNVVENQQSKVTNLESFVPKTSENTKHQSEEITTEHVKHRKSKTGHSDWLKHDSMNVGSVSHKHRKCARIQTDFPSSVLTQTEKPPQQAMYNVNPPFSLSNFGVPTVSTSTPNAPNFPAYGIPSFPYISSSYSPNTNTPPFVIPVMYMGTLPCYPAVPNIVPVNNVPMWSYATPVPPKKTTTAADHMKNWSS